MPYITQDRRKVIDAKPSEVNDYGELNYLVTTMLIKMWKERPSYSMWHVMRRDKEHFVYDLSEVVNHKFTILDLRTAVEEALDEFRDRVIRRYEDGKIAQNGDVYGR
jgi:hypothetical protein